MITSRTLAPSDLAACARVAAYVLAAVERAGLLTDDRPALAVDALRDGDLAECVRLADDCARENPRSTALGLLAHLLASSVRVGLHGRAMIDGETQAPCATRFADILTMCREDETFDAARAIVAELAA